MITIYGKFNPYIAESLNVLQQLDQDAIDAMVDELVALRAHGGRLFLIGVGGSAANCSHAAADFRTLCDINAVACDSMAEFTALANDHSWGQVFVKWLIAREAGPNDLLYVMSVGGGHTLYSQNLVNAMNWAQGLGSGMPIIGVAGRDGGMLSVCATACVIVPDPADKALTTPITESMQSIIAHLLVSHPSLKVHKTAWEEK